MSSGSRHPSHQRRYPRCRLEMAVHYHTADGLESGRCIDVGGGGILISRRHSIKVGTTVTVRFTPPGLDRTLSFEGRVVSQHLSGDGEGPPRMAAFAVAFGEEQRDEIALLDRLVRLALSEQTGRAPESFRPAQEAQLAGIRMRSSSAENEAHEPLRIVASPEIDQPNPTGLLALDDADAAPPPDPAELRPPPAPPARIGTTRRKPQPIQPRRPRASSPPSPAGETGKPEVEYVVRRMRSGEQAASEPEPAGAKPRWAPPPRREPSVTLRRDAGSGDAEKESAPRRLPAAPVVVPVAEDRPGFAVRYETVSDFLEAYADRLGSNGVLIRTASRIPPGVELEIRFELPQHPEPIVVSGTVISCHPPLPGDPPSLGGLLIGFSDVDEPGVRLLHELARLPRDRRP